MPLRPFALLATLCLLLAGMTACERKPVELAGATSEPAAAVRNLVGYLERDDLAGFAKAAVPPADYAVLDAAWREGRSRWPISELPLDDQLVPMLNALAAKGSEARLQRSFEQQFARQDTDLRDAARSLGLFGTQYVKKEGQYTTEERQHYTQIIGALSTWAQQAPLGDPALARSSIKGLAAAARKTGIDSEQTLQAAGMDASLRKLSPFLAEAKITFARYGLPLSTTLTHLRTGLVKQQGDFATVRIHYPLGDTDIDSQVQLERRDGRWYLSEYLHQVDRVRAESPPPEATAPSPATPPATSSEASD